MLKEATVGTTGTAQENVLINNHLKAGYLFKRFKNWHFQNGLFDYKLVEQ